MRLLTFRLFKFSRASDAANFVFFCFVFVNKKSTSCRVLKDFDTFGVINVSTLGPKSIRISWKLLFQVITDEVSITWQNSGHFLICKSYQIFDVQASDLDALCSVGLYFSFFSPLLLRQKWLIRSFYATNVLYLLLNDREW